MMIILISSTTATAASTFVVGRRVDIPNFEQNPDIQNLARFAVDEYNKQQQVSFIYINS